MVMKSRIKIGDKYGRLEVIEILQKEPRKNRRYLLKCRCGKITDQAGSNLLSGSIVSCGCQKKESVTAFNKRTKSKYQGITGNADLSWLWITWKNMMARCSNLSNKDYAGRGIVACKFISEKPQNLLAIVGIKPGSKYSIDRTDNDGDYSCGECEECRSNRWTRNIRWATRKEQNLNRHNTVLVTAFGKTMAKSQWAELTGISWTTISDRLNAGWTPEVALGTPVRKGNYRRGKRS